MARTNPFLFGDQGYTEHDLEVIIENGIGAAQWERLRNIEQHFASQSRWKSWVLKQLTKHGIPVSAAAAIYKAYFSPSREREAASLGKRLRSKQEEAGHKMVRRTPDDHIDKFPDINGETDDEMDGKHDHEAGGDVAKKSTQATFQGSKETPVTVARPIYQHPRTMTVVVPMTYYFSCVVNNHNTSTDLRILMNANRGHILSTVTAAFANAAGGGSGTGAYPAHVKASGNLGFFRGRIPTNRFVRDQWSGYGNQAHEFYNDAMWVGTTTNSDSFPIPYTTARPANRDGWEKLYNFYTVLGNEWTLTIQNASNPYELNSTTPAVHNDAVAYHDYETQSVNDVNDVIPTAVSLYDVMFWPESKFTHIPHHEMGRPLITQLTGRYKGYGDESVLNAMDDKRWNKIADLPTKQDILHIKFWPDALQGNANGRVRLNLCLTMKQIIQYKGLRQNLKWPNKTDPPAQIPVQYPLDFLARTA